MHKGLQGVFEGDMGDEKCSDMGYSGRIFGRIWGFYVYSTRLSIQCTPLLSPLFYLRLTLFMGRESSLMP